MHSAKYVKKKVNQGSMSSQKAVLQNGKISMLDMDDEIHVIVDSDDEISFPVTVDKATNLTSKSSPVACSINPKLKNSSPRTKCPCIFCVDIPVNIKKEPNDGILALHKIKKESDSVSITVNGVKKHSEQSRRVKGTNTRPRNRGQFTSKTNKLPAANGQKIKKECCPISLNSSKTQNVSLSHTTSNPHIVKLKNKFVEKRAPKTPGSVAGARKQATPASQNGKMSSSKPMIVNLISKKDDDVVIESGQDSASLLRMKSDCSSRPCFSGDSKRPQVKITPNNHKPHIDTISIDSSDSEIEVLDCSPGLQKKKTLHACNGSAKKSMANIPKLKGVCRKSSLLTQLEYSSSEDDGSNSSFPISFKKQRLSEYPPYQRPGDSIDTSYISIDDDDDDVLIETDKASASSAQVPSSSNKSSSAVRKASAVSPGSSTDSKGYENISLFMPDLDLNVISSKLKGKDLKSSRELKSLYNHLNEIQWAHDQSFKTLLRNPSYIRHSERATGKATAEKLQVRRGVVKKPVSKNVQLKNAAQKQNKLNRINPLKGLDPKKFSSIVNKRKKRIFTSRKSGLSMKKDVIKRSSKKTQRSPKSQLQPTKARANAGQAKSTGAVHSSNIMIPKIKLERCEDPSSGKSQNGSAQKKKRDNRNIQAKFTAILAKFIASENSAASSSANGCSTSSQQNKLRDQLCSELGTIPELFKKFTSYLDQETTEKSAKKKKVDDETLKTSVKQAESLLRFKEIKAKKELNYYHAFFMPNEIRQNRLNIDAIKELIDFLQLATKDERCHAVLISSSGSYFCTGLDFSSIVGSNKKQEIEDLANVVRDLAQALGSFSKPLIAAVNGMTVGLGVSILAFCDVVLASDKATFHVPATDLGYTPECGVTLTLPKVVGFMAAQQMLVEGRRLTARQANVQGLVSEVLWPAGFLNIVTSRVQKIAAKPMPALEATNLLVRRNLWDKLQTHIEYERNLLISQWQSAQCQANLKQLLQTGWTD